MHLPGSEVRTQPQMSTATVLTTHSFWASLLMTARLSISNKAHCTVQPRQKEEKKKSLKLGNLGTAIRCFKDAEML